MRAKNADEPFLGLRVDKNSPTPVYAQIADAIKALIAKGGAGVGAPLPPERVLCEHFGISRMPLRQAYDGLEREGLIESHRGRGTFVSPPRLQKQQQELRGFTEEIVARGATPSSKADLFPQHPAVFRGPLVLRPARRPDAVRSGADRKSVV